jgi:peptidoglycan/LPS O-acetylase OafA/YrhL
MLIFLIALMSIHEPAWERIANPLPFTALYFSYGLCIALLVCAIAASDDDGLLVRTLEWKPLAALGRISYGFYLYHGFIPDFARSARLDALFGAQGMPWWARLLAVLAGFLLTVVLSVLSWRFIEAPILKLKNRRFMRRPSAQGHTERLRDWGSSNVHGASQSAE